MTVNQTRQPRNSLETNLRLPSVGARLASGVYCGRVVRGDAGALACSGIADTTNRSPRLINQILGDRLCLVVLTTVHESARVYNDPGLGNSHGRGTLSAERTVRAARRCTPGCLRRSR
jgi:hypothetical protein